MTYCVASSKLSEFFLGLGGFILKRSSLLSLLLGVSVAFFGARTYQLWQAGPWDLPVSGKAKAAPAAEPLKEEPPQFQLANTRNIIDKNLFDPERGATKKNEEKAQADNAATQRIRSMILLGTAILGNSRYAIMQEPQNSPGARAQPTKTPAGGSGQMRLKQGDTVEGFRLSEIRDKSVVFTRGASKVELSIDYFRPGEEPPARAGAPAPAAPRPGLSPRVGARVPPTPEQSQLPPASQSNPSAVERARQALRERQLQPPQQPAGRPPERVVPPSAGSAPAQNPQ